jgi:hypothetical protein
MCLLTNGIRVNACDREEKYESLVEEFANHVNTLYIAFIPQQVLRCPIEAYQYLSQWPSRVQSKRLYNLQR